ncbi:MAG: T9SS type A sorting domain-containing protein [Bacteroidetes bacterium]|nr:T9SS type A sorting domain-containing protein [Bacteroidota bacterium]
MKQFFLFVVLIKFCTILQAQTTTSISITYTPASCPTCCDGMAYLTFSGPAYCSPYVVMWSNGATTTMVYNVCPGPLTATVISGGGAGCPAQICDTLITYTLATQVKETDGKMHRITVNNPVSDFLHTHYLGEPGNYFLDIVNLEGYILETYPFHSSVQEMSIPLQQLEDGLYYLCLRSDTQVLEHRKLVISH